MTGRSIVAVISGLFIVLIGAALVAGATTILTQQRDSDDFFVTNASTFETSTYAIVSDDIELLSDTPTWVIDRLVHPIEFRVSGTNAGAAPLFIGIATSEDANRFLSGVPFDEIAGIDVDDSTITSVEYKAHPGTATPVPPAGVDIWAASVEGVGPVTLDWAYETGSWTLVAMNGDASADVEADVVLGARVPNMIAGGWIAIAIGVLFVVGGGYLLYRGFRGKDDAEPTMVVDLSEPKPASAAPETEQKPLVHN